MKIPGVVGLSWMLSFPCARGKNDEGFWCAWAQSWTQKKVVGTMPPPLKRKKKKFKQYESKYFPKEKRGGQIGRPFKSVKPFLLGLIRQSWATECMPEMGQRTMNHLRGKAVSRKPGQLCSLSILTFLYLLVWSWVSDITFGDSAFPFLGSTFHSVGWAEVPR